MAEPTVSAPSPALPSMADQVPYVPVSWLAVGAASVAGLFALLLLVMGLLSSRARKPLLEEELLILALVAIVLSFAARRVVRNSEGTRDGTLFGVDLINAAWWTALVLGLGYVSYLLAIEYSIRRDAKNEVQGFSDLILKGDPESLTRAFHRTQDPNQRRTIRPDDAAQMEGRWRNEFVGFRQCDLVRLATRNSDSKLEIGGLRDWSFKQTGVECTFTATLTNAEGTFPIQVPLRAIESGGSGTEGSGRQWQIVFTQNGFIQKDQALLTPYGWYVAHLSITGGEFGRQFISACSNRELRLSAYLEFTRAKIEEQPELMPLTIAAFRARNAVLGVAAGSSWKPGNELYDATANRLFTLPAGAKPSEEQSKIFRYAWNTVGFVKAGERLRESSDLSDQLTFADSHIELRVPIEIPLSGTKGDFSAARGKLVLICNDLAIVEEVKRLRGSANPAQATAIPLEGISLKSVTWRALWVESDLKPIRVEQKQIPPTAGGGPEGP